MPHDEQPLTRRALRELERQKPRKQQKEDAKAAEEADAERRAAATAAATDAPVATPEPTTEPDSVPAEPGVSAPVTDSVDVVPFAPATPAGAAPSLSRRARRVVSVDHPFAEQHAAGSQDAAGAGDADRGEAQPEAQAEAPSSPTTGPIIAEIIPEAPETNSIEIVPTGSVETIEDTRGDSSGSGFSEDTSEVAVPVEELIVVDPSVDEEVATQEDEEFAEIDDTVAPEAVHVITIDENPSGPILSPLFPKSDERAREVDAARAQSPFDALIATRGVGSSNSVSTTSALVLPSVPHHGDVGTALDETGEVIITGSIDLPMSLGSMGAAPADGLESSELDAYLDPDGDVGSDVAPVSASRAVSTHGASSGLIAPPKRSRANAPVILMVTAGVLAVGVVGLLVAVFALRIF
ncbi:hypothetical protein B7R22_05670 [Subtercola boreus]|uniref:Uncharacterized protein n=1 Tax=Subtercola boreus TaxID=120213 RepID=A0A3E0W2T8_9MICO|nr:hypothetical protein B7R22_05670 [Subtercola boreus]